MVAWDNCIRHGMQFKPDIKKLQDYIYGWGNIVYTYREFAPIDDQQSRNGADILDFLGNSSQLTEFIGVEHDPADGIRISAPFGKAKWFAVA